MKYFLIASLIAMAICYPVPDGNPHVFDFQGTQFTLDGQPFRFVACELHYPRIPKAYWEHRLLMSKALGCNVVSAYVFWNYHE
jgi:beta-galactosidase